jgi:hypothetical protein
MIPFAAATSVRLLAWLAVVGLLIWKYRGNKMIVFGTLILGCAALAVLLSFVPGTPDWLTGTVVVLFLLMAIGMIPLALVLMIQHMRRKGSPENSSNRQRGSEL